MPSDKSNDLDAVRSIKQFIRRYFPSAVECPHCHGTGMVRKPRLSGVQGHPEMTRPPDSQRATNPLRKHYPLPTGKRHGGWDR